MLDHLGQPDNAARLRDAIVATLEAKDSLTPDLGGGQHDVIRQGDRQPDLIWSRL